MGCAGCQKSAVERLRAKLERRSESAVARLARINVKGYVRKKDQGGGFEHVGSYVRKGDLIPNLPGTGSGPSGGKGPVAKVPPAKPGAKAPSVAADAEIKGKNIQKGTGTKSDPYITDDVDTAARLLGEQKYVQLKQKRQVSTLLDKLAEIVDDARSRGDKAPTYDLCKVTVEGSNLFCVESKGIPRIKMPQLGGIPTPGSEADDEKRFPKNEKGEVNLSAAFIDHLKGRGIGVEDQRIPAEYLKASQNELNGAKVAGITNAMEAGKLAPDDQAIFVSEDDYVIDGHHRWAAAVALGIERNEKIELATHTVQTDIISILRLANAWTEEMGLAHAGVGENRTADAEAKKK